jgi:hypothetical protein
VGPGASYHHPAGRKNSRGVSAPVGPGEDRDFLNFFQNFMQNLYKKVSPFVDQHISKILLRVFSIFISDFFLIFSPKFCLSFC